MAPARIDLLLGGVLLLAAVGSAVGVLTYEDDRQGAVFLVDWTTDVLALEAAPVSHQGAGDVEVALPVNATNVTRVQLTVTVQGAAARVQPTAVRVEVVPPTGNATAVEATLPAGPTASVEVPVEVVLGEVPDVAQVQAGSSADALARLSAAHATDDAQGEWVVRVSLAPGAPGPLGQEAYTVTVAGEATTFEAQVRAQAPDVSEEA